jgi:hypothetical protein
LKEEALDRTLWRTRFGRGYGPVVRQTTEWMRNKGRAAANTVKHVRGNSELAEEPVEVLKTILFHWAGCMFVPLLVCLVGGFVG